MVGQLLNLRSCAEKKKQKVLDVKDIPIPESAKFVKEEEIEVKKPVLKISMRKSKARKWIGLHTSTEPESREVDITSSKIVKWKILRHGGKGYCHLIRANQRDSVFVNFGAMLHNISRDDLVDLYKIVLQKTIAYGPEEDLERAFAENLRNMFDPEKFNRLELGLDGNVWYVGPFKVLEKVGSIAYKLELPQELIRVHNTFHVSNLKKCYSDEPLAVPLEGIHVEDKLHFMEEPVEIMDREVKWLKQSRIPIVKVRWNSRRGPEFTWEHEDQFQKKYLHLFTKPVHSLSVAT
ncbi:hypothetical protein Tco_0449285 [Tanacetum coccineum]